MRLPYIRQALHLGAADAVREYAVWGGVPRYWELREAKGSFVESLWHNVFSAERVLYDEPARLLEDEKEDTVKTSSIMTYVANGARRLSEIASRSGEPATNLSRPLKKLVDLGFLERETPFGTSGKNAKKSLYKIADPFMAFYFRFVMPNKSYSSRGRRAIIERDLLKHFPEYLGGQREKMCRNAVTGNIVGGILYGEAKRWWGTVLNENNKPERIEMDILAESADKCYLLVGECKWTGRENWKLLTNELIRKARLLPFSKNHEIVPVLFLKNKPENDTGNTLLPEDVIELEKSS